MLLDALAAELNSLRPQVGQAISPETAMRLTLSEALQGSGHVSPNPLVGCVIVDASHNFLSSGAHLVYGEGHAEANAMRGISGAHTVYVTLEPCAHTGKQPPCANLLLRSGIKHLVYALLDPAPYVSGAGIGRLQAGGVICELGPLTWQRNAAEVAEFFLHDIKTKRPFVGLKVAKSADGFIARRGDKRAWITDVRSRAYGHFLRQRYDAILVGPQTVLKDNPSLSVREAIAGNLRTRTPMRIVYDYRDNLAMHVAPDRLNLLSSERERTVWVTPRGSAQKQILEAWDVTHIEAANDISKLLQELYRQGIRSLLIEGGSSVYANFIDAKLVDRLHIFEAPQNLRDQCPQDELVHWLSKSLHWAGKEQELLATFEKAKTERLERDTLSEFTS